MRAGATQYCRSRLATGDLVAVGVGLALLWLCRRSWPTNGANSYRHESALEPTVVWYGKSPFELRKLILHHLRHGFCSRQRSTSNQAVLASSWGSLIHARQNGLPPSQAASARVRPISLSARSLSARSCRRWNA